MEAIVDWVMVVDPGLRGKETLEAIVISSTGGTGWRPTPQATQWP